MSRFSRFCKGRKRSGELVQGFFDEHHWVVSIVARGTWCFSPPPLELVIEGVDSTGKLIVIDCAIHITSLKKYLSQYMESLLRPGLVSAFPTLASDHQEIFSLIENRRVNYIYKNQKDHYSICSDMAVLSSTVVPIAKAQDLLASIDSDITQFITGTNTAITEIQADRTPNLEKCFEVMMPYTDTEGHVDTIKWVKKYLDVAGIHRSDLPAEMFSDTYFAVVQELGLGNRRVLSVENSASNSDCCVLL